MANIGKTITTAGGTLNHKVRDAQSVHWGRPTTAADGKGQILVNAIKRNASAGMRSSALLAPVADILCGSPKGNETGILLPLVSVGGKLVQYVATEGSDALTYGATYAWARAKRATPDAAHTAAKTRSDGVRAAALKWSQRLSYGACVLASEVGFALGGILNGLGIAIGGLLGALFGVGQGTYEIGKNGYAAYKAGRAEAAEHKQAERLGKLRKMMQDTASSPISSPSEAGQPFADAVLV